MARFIYSGFNSDDVIEQLYSYIEVYEEQDPELCVPFWLEIYCYPENEQNKGEANFVIINKDSIKAECKVVATNDELIDFAMIKNRAEYENRIIKPLQSALNKNQNYNLEVVFGCAIKMV